MNIGGDAADSAASAYKLGWFAMPDPSDRPATRSDGVMSHLQRHPILVEVGVSNFPTKGAGALSSAYRGAYSNPAIVLEKTLARISKFADVLSAHNTVAPVGRSHGVSEVIGVGIDEWMDRWDRSMDWDRICHDGVYVHSKCGPLVSYGPKSSSSTPMALERMGLNMQRDVAFKHCLQPRCTLAALQSFAWTDNRTVTAAPRILKVGAAGVGEHILACLNNSATIDFGKVDVCTVLKPSPSWALASALIISFTAVLLALIIVRGAVFEIRMHNDPIRGRDRKSAASTHQRGDQSVKSAGDAAPATAAALHRTEEHKPEEFELTGLKAIPPLNNSSFTTTATSKYGGMQTFSIKLVSSNRVSPAKLKTLLCAHVSVQADRLGEQIEAEIAAQRLLNHTDADALAVSVIYKRTLEAYFSWNVWRARSGTRNTGMLPAWLASRLVTSLGQLGASSAEGGQISKYDVGSVVSVSPVPVFPLDGTHTTVVGSAYAEMLVLRVMESLSEQTLHAPERIASLFHHVRCEWQATTAAARGNDANWQFVIRLDDLHGGLSQLHANGNPYTDINFDDMNDNGLDDCHESPMRKRWLEPRGVFVLFDIIRNFAPVIVIKHWAFTFTWFLTHWDDYSDELVSTDWQNLAVNSAMRDAIFSLVVELLLKVVYTGLYQGANASVINPRAYIVQHSLLSLLYFVAACVFIAGAATGDEAKGNYVGISYVYGFTRLICMFLHSLWAEYGYRWGSASISLTLCDRHTNLTNMSNVALTETRPLSENGATRNGTKKLFPLRKQGIDFLILRESENPSRFFTT